MRSAIAFAAALGALAASAAARAADCPADGVRFGVEPYAPAQQLRPVYTDLAKLIGDKLGCKVQLTLAANNAAEIEAMRGGKLEIGEFGLLAYVLAHQVAKAEAVATFGGKDGKPATYFASIVTWAGSGVDKLDDVRGKSFAY